MGIYVCRAVDTEEYREIIQCIRDGYMDHKPNKQIATILILEANLGCRIGDIIALTTDSFVKDGNRWKLNIVEEKTGKKRTFIIPQPVKDFIDKWIDSQGILAHERLFSITSQAVWKALRNVTDYLGLENVSTHSFRKKLATDLYNKTHDIELVREFLNHSSTRVTQEYIRRSTEQLENAINVCVDIV